MLRVKGLNRSQTNGHRTNNVQGAPTPGYPDMPMRGSLIAVFLPTSITRVSRIRRVREVETALVHCKFVGVPRRQRVIDAQQSSLIEPDKHATK